ncbi:MAG: NlpC/P60 family protein [Bifidobacterium criceti]|nr:NlpC/P60 family protein [Bifidobacterium criceti]
MKRSISITTAAALAASLFAGAPAAVADDAASSSNYVVSTRSFPKVNTAKTDFFAEATSTNVDEDSNWGGLESMDVPQTKSTAEKEAEQQAKEQEEARKRAEEEEAARQQAAAAASQQAEAAASRSQEREPVAEEAQQPAQSSASSWNVPTSKNGAAIAQFALQFRGYPYVFGGNTPGGWDCSGFVQWVFSQFGISLPRTSGAQATVGVAVPSIDQAQPGDIIANGMHAAIYIGNGMVMNAMTPELGTGTSSLAVFSGGYSIRRVL